VRYLGWGGPVGNRLKASSSDHMATRTGDLWKIQIFRAMSEWVRAVFINLDACHAKLVFSGGGPYLTLTSSASSGDDTRQS
jgi:hypothetical protein